MKRYLIAGNWKMNLDRQSSVELAEALAREFSTSADVDIVICPPAVYLDAAAAAVVGSAVEIGAQNMYHQTGGAFTGELSPAMLRDIGCRYVIIGHSERRALFGESNDQVNDKTKAALAAGLIPIVCVGETLEQRLADRTAEVIRDQFDGSLAGIGDVGIARLVLAYEPVWAIGTGKVATPEQAERVHADLRKMLENRYNAAAAGQVPILYGGSVKPDNASQLLIQKNVDGALVGGASLKADSFSSIIHAANDLVAATQ